MLKLMVQIAICLGILTAAGAAVAQAPGGGDRGPLGAGLVLGAPSALTAKYWVERREAWDFGVGWDLDDYFLLYADYLWHFPEWPGQINIRVRNLYPYVGLGGLFVIYSDDEVKRDKNDDDSLRLLMRVPVGVEWMAPKVPIGVFVELTPGLKLIPRVSGYFGGGIGARFYFP